MPYPTSDTMFLLRGIGALILFLLSFFMITYPIAMVLTLLSAILLLRGCPLCWLMELSIRINRKQSDQLSNRIK